MEATSDDETYGDNVASSGSGDVWVELNYSTTDGSVTSVTIGSGGVTPDSTDGTLYHHIGHYEADGDTFILTQSANGPLNASICRNWFATEEPYYVAGWV
jgi:hypothetical protein